MDNEEDDSADSVLRGVAAAPARRPPTSFRGSSRFEPLRRLGEGSFGVVYEALDRETGSRIAVKVLRRLTPETLFRFKHEFRALPDVSHPNVIRLGRLHQDGEDWFFTMELIEGLDFLTWIRNAPERLVPAFEQLARGVTRLHAAGIVHRDLKPSNVLVDRSGRVVVVDFGLAGLGTSADPMVSGAGGTPLYMAPEQVTDKGVGPASDWYAVGVMLYEALAGARPFEGTALEVMAAKAQLAPRPLPHLADGAPRALGELCLKLLQAAPGARADGREVQQRLALQAEAAPLVDAEGAAPEQFVGRKPELARLLRGWSQLEAGRPIVALVSGSSGIGKSALASEFCEQVRARAPQLLLFAGRCFEQESVPFKAFDSLVDEIARQLLCLDETEVRAVLPDDPAALPRLFPVLARVALIAHAPTSVPLGDGVEGRQRAFAALRQLLVRLGRRRPLMLSIDDLQWGDADSATLLGVILQGADAPKLFLVATYRSDDRDDSECLRELLPRLRRLASPGPLVLEEVALEGLDPAAAREAAMATLEEPDSARAELIARESGGLPFFIRQLARFGSAEGRLTQPTGPANPSSLLEQAICARLDALPSAAQRLLDVLAVAGQPVSRRAAFAAAGSAGSELTAMSILRVERLSCARQHSQTDQLETYHDRIREIVAARMPAARKTELHLSLAVSLEREGGDPGLLARHFHQAGRDEVASGWSATAGDRAAGALAFSAAAQHYRLAWEWFPGSASRGTYLTRRRAEVLASAGRGAEAGKLFLELAQGASGEAALDLRRAGVDQLLVSGMIETGVAELRSLAAEVRLRFPGSQAMAVLTMVWSLLVLWFRGALTGQARAGVVSPADLRRADVAASAFRGLLPVDPAKAGHFAVAELFFARRSAEKRRLSLSLARVGSGVLGPGPRWLARLGKRLLDTSAEIAKGLDDAHLHGALSIARGAHAFWDGRWGEAIDLADRGLEILGRGAGDAGHEWNLAQVVAVRSLEELGQWSEAQRRSERMLSDAIARGDRYAQTSARLALGMETLTAGDAAAAVQWADEATSSWTRDTYSVQQLYALRVRLYAELSTGKGATALDSLTAAWPHIRAGMHLAIKASLIDLLVLRGALAIAAADLKGDDRCLRLAAKTAGALAATSRVDALGHAAALRAAVATRRDPGDRARSLWRAAEHHYSTAGMQACTLGTRLVQARLEQSSLSESIVALRSLGVGDPERWVEWSLPGARKPN